MGGAIAKGLVDSSLVKASDITCTATSDATLAKIKHINEDINTTKNNCEAVKNADVVLFAVKPWLMNEIIGEVKEGMNYDRQIVVSVAAGLSAADLNGFLKKEGESLPVLFRLIPNTAIEVGSSVTFMSVHNGATQEQINMLMQLFNTMGQTFIVDEKKMEAGMIAASCGIAFALRYIRAAVEGSVELGLAPGVAKEIVANTVKGAADLLLKNQSHPEVEIDKVTTPGGLTIKGLNEMEKYGFTTAVIEGLKACSK